MNNLGTTNVKNIKTIIDNIYSGGSFYIKYSSDLYLALAFIVIILFLSLFFYFKLNINFYKTNWNEYRCNPLIMPFAGYINSTPGLSSYEYAYNNYNQCVSELMQANQASSAQSDDLDELAMLSSDGVSSSSAGLAGLQFKNLLQGLGNLNFAQFADLLLGLPTFPSISNLLFSQLIGLLELIDTAFTMLVTLINAFYYYLKGFGLFVVLMLVVIIAIILVLLGIAEGFLSILFIGWVLFLIAMIVLIFLFIFLIITGIVIIIIDLLADVSYDLSQTVTDLQNEIKQNDQIISDNSGSGSGSGS